MKIKPRTKEMMVIKTRQNALIMTDIQLDFCPGGALAVNEGDQIIPVVNAIAAKFDKIIATQDWHPADHLSFAANHPGKNIHDMVELGDVPQVLWPTHCVQGAPGAGFHPDLDLRPIDLIVRKGTNRHIDSYSAFMENDKKTQTGLEGFLKGLGISQLFFTGLATDYCVFYSALDAVNLGFDVFVILDACRGVNVPENNVKNAEKEMARQGVTLIQSGELSQ
jgi:nicotinamidase/pyrazinamidase